MNEETRDSARLELRNPFPGLRAFHRDEDYLFFGRDEQTTELATRLRKNRFLAVVGTSGSGKSSLVRAGLIPRLLAGGMRGAGSSWEVAVLRPGGRPIAHLADALCEADLYDTRMEGALASLQVTLRRSRLGLVEAVRQSDMEEGTNLLVVVDQFEEVFRFRGTGAEAEEQAHDFVSLLLEASSGQDAPIYVVITMRSDFIGDCSQFAGLAEAVNRGEYLIPRLSREQCRAAIEGPIRVAAGEATPQLVQRVLNDLGPDQDRLPVLQHALMRTWDAWQADHAEGEAVDIRHYEATGGMREALSRHADEVFAELPDDRHRWVAARLFKALTERGSDNREVRRPARLAALAEITGARDAELRAVIEAYRRAGRTFLMPAERVALDPATVIDISHESLMRVWRRLQGWVEEEAQSARIYRRLADTAHLHSRGKAGLFREPDLPIALAWRRESEPNAAWAARYHEGFEEATRFLEASEAAERAEREAREAARQRELEQARILAATQARAARSFKRFAVGVSALALVAMALSVWALILKDRAEKSESLADASARAADASRADAEAARKDALIARDQALHEQGRVWLERAGFLLEEKRFLAAKLLAGRALGFEGFGRSSRGDAFRAEYPVLLRRESDEWISAGELIRDLPDYPTVWMSPARAQGGSIVLAIEFSPDSGRVATTSVGRDFRKGTVVVWDVASGAARLDIPVSSPGRSLSFSPDGSRLAFADRQQGTPTICVWDLAARQEVLRIRQPAFVSDCEFDPAGATLATMSSDSVVRLWDAMSGREVETLRGSWRLASRLAFAPDGGTIALGSTDNSIQILNIRAPSDPPRTLQGHTSTVTDLQFSRDGKVLASASLDGTVRVWDVESGTQRLALQHPGMAVYGVSIQPGGTLVASAARDGLLRLWNLDTGALEPPVQTSEGTGPVPVAYSTRFSPDGRLLGWGRADGTIEILDVAARTTRYRVAGHTAALRSVASSPDGTQLASCGLDRTVRLWSAGTGEELARFEGHAAFLDVEYRPDGGALAAADEGGEIHLYDLARREEVGALEGHSAAVNDIDFDASGRRLVSACADGSIRLWDIEDMARGREVGRLDAGGPVLAIALGADGLLASGGEERTVRLWDTAGKQAVRQLEGHGGAVHALAFSPDGAILASGSEDRTIRLWDAASGREIARLDGHTDTIGGVAFSPDGSTLASAGMGRDGTIRLWNIPARRLQATLDGHPDGVTAVAFCPDGITLATAGEDASVRLWDLSRLEVGRLESEGASVRSLDYDPEGKVLATQGRSGSILLLDAFDGHRIRSFEGSNRPAEDLAFSKDGMYLASAGRDRVVRLWHVGTGEAIWTSPTFGDWVRSVRFSPDGSLLAAASDDRSVRLLDVATGRLVRTFSGHGNFVAGAAFSPDGSRIVSASLDGTIRLWDVETGQEVSRLEVKARDSRETVGYRGLDIHPGGRLLATCDGTEAIHLWDLEKGDVVAVLESAGAAFEGVRFSADGKILAALGGTGLRLWDVAARREVGSFDLSRDEESGESLQVRFSPDGGRVAFGDPDGVIHIIDARRRRREPSRLAGWLDWFLIDGGGGVRPTLPRSLYQPARIELDAPAEGSAIATLRRWRDRGEGEGMWRELFERYLAAGNLASAALLLERLPPETSGSERGLLASALVAEAERVAAKPEGFARVTALLERAERLTPRAPRAFAVRALALDARGDADAADRELDLGIQRAHEMGEPMRAELLWLIDQRLTMCLRRGDLAGAGRAIEPALSLPYTRPGPRSLLLGRYWRGVQDDALKRYQAGEPAAARAAALLEALRWALDRTPIHEAAWPLAEAIEGLQGRAEGSRLVDRPAAWRYLDDGSDPGAAWRALDFDDRAWRSGPAPLGFGDRREKTRLRRNLRADDSIGETTITYYFRHRFEVKVLDKASTFILIEMARDDGAVVYLNGEEILRDAMPEGPVNPRTFATVTASGAEESRVREYRVRTDSLRVGPNVLAVEVHQATPDSSDLHFELGLAVGRPALLILGLNDPAVLAEAARDAISVAPPAVRTTWGSALEFALAAGSMAGSQGARDLDLWRVRRRLQAWLGNGDAVLETLRREIEARESSADGLDALRRSDLQAQLARRLEAAGRSEEAAAGLRAWFDGELRTRGAIRLNCGGDAFLGSGDTLWNGDAFCAEGRSIGFDGNVFGASDRALYARFREFAPEGEQGYHLPLPDGLYRVRLRLAKILLDEGGRQEFDVLLQGETALVGYDGVRAAGFEVEDPEDLAARVAGGSLDIAFRARPGSAPPRIAGIEVSPIDEEEHRRLLRERDDALWARASLEEQGGVRIDCGSVEAYRAADGRTWSRDRCYVGGSPASRSSRVAGQYAGAIEGTEDDPLYLTERFFAGTAPFAYRVPLPPGRYRVTLRFAEVWAPFAEKGRRVFDVLLEGRSVLEGFDVFDAAGYATAVDRAFDAEVSDGLLDIEFVLRSENPKISAIEIEAIPER